MIPISKLSPGPVLGILLVGVFLTGLVTIFYQIGKVVTRLFF